jgi:hypothetical protein
MRAKNWANTLSGRLRTRQELSQEGFRQALQSQRHIATS